MVTVIAGLAVCLCSLLDLYTATVIPASHPDAGTVLVGIRFYGASPLGAPFLAQAVPALMLVAALAALPGALGRPPAALVSAVAAPPITPTASSTS